MLEMLLHCSLVKHHRNINASIHSHSHTHCCFSFPLSSLQKLPSMLSSDSHRAHTNAHVLARAQQQRQSGPLFIRLANESSVNSPLGYVVELTFRRRDVWLQMHAASEPAPKTKTRCSVFHGSSYHMLTGCGSCLFECTVMMLLCLPGRVLYVRAQYTREKIRVWMLWWDLWHIPHIKYNLIVFSTVCDGATL